ncbi:PAS domain-containing protein [Mesorhizobium sp. M1227]|uniref:PAS domain-containing protein n=1 Tax=unclassified Mesorhizobium TaxID=325217 RepID=UPI00333D09E9
MERPVSKDGDGAEAAPFSSEQELRLLVETLPTLVWQAEPEGNIEYVNKRVLDYFGAPLDEITGWGWVDRVHPDDVAFKVKNWLANLETKSPSDVVCRFRGANGQHRWFNVRGAPLKASDGRVLRWYGVLIDVDDQKNAEEAVRESEYKLRQIFETVPGLIWLAEPNGNMSYVNQRILDYISAPFEETIGSGWEAFIHPDDRPETAKVFQQAIQTVTSYEIVHRLRRSDGAYRWHHTRAEPMRDQQGNVIQWYGLSVDIDEAKRAEDRLRRSEAFLAEAQRLSHTGSTSYNDTTLLYWSEETYHIFGFDPARGLPSFEAATQRVHPHDRDRVVATAERAYTEKGGYSIEYRIVLPDGTVKHLDTIGRPVFSSDGRIVEFFCINMDVTERKQAEDQLRRSEAFLAEAQRLSHTGASAYTATKILYWSEETYRIWGFDPEQGIPALGAVTQRIHPDDRDRAHAQPVRALSDKIGYSHSYRIVLPDGTVKHIESVGEPVLSSSGELVVEVVATQIDVTERKRAEDALRESEHRLRQIFETVPGLLWSTDPAGEPTQLNQRMLDYTGMLFEDFKHGGWEAFLHPDDSSETIRALQQAIQTGTSYQAVHRLRRADGEFRWYHTRGEPLRDRQGHIVQWYGLSVDIDEAKKVEDRLRRSEAYLAEAQRLSHSGVSAYNETKILYGSDETFRIWGFDPAEGVPSREAVFQRIHPGDVDRLNEVVQRAVIEKRGYSIGYRIVLPDGTVKHLETIGQTVFSPSGELAEIVTTQIDVTERKKAEDQLRRSEAYLAEAQRLSHTGTWALNTTTMQYLYWSDESYRIWAFDPRDGLPSRDALWQRIHPDDRDGVWARIQEALRHKEDYSGEFRIVLPDRTVKHLAATSHHLFSTIGELAEVIGTNVDVTERKRTEEAVRESEAKFRDYAESASDWFWEIGPDYRFTLLTDNAFGADSADRIGMACWDRALDLETEPEKWRLLRATLDARKSFRDFVYHSARQNGSSIHVKVTGKPVFDAEGEFRGYRGTGTDVTAFMRAQEEHERLRQLESDLAHMNRVSVMGELTASLAHEITQPIAAARNNARAAMHFLDRNPPDLSEIREALASIVDDADRAGDIIDRIRDHIKKAPPRKSRFDLNKAIDEVIGLAGSAITENGVSVRTRLAEALSPVEGDRVQLQQVVLNLILNAVEAMSTLKAGPRELSISTEQAQTGGILVSVRDSGPGIDPDNLDRVFQAFYTTKSNGVGMGLSISQSIIEAHGGRLWADMNASGGAALRFSLPVDGKELTNSHRPVDKTAQPHEATLSGAAHQTAYEGSKRPRRSGRGSDQGRRGRP